MPGRRRTAVASVAVGLLLAAPTGSAAAAPPAQGYRATPLLAVNNPYGNAFAPSTSGNPITSTGRVAGFVTYGSFSLRAAVLDTRTGLAETFDEDRPSFAVDVNEQGDVLVDQEGPDVERAAFYPHGGGVVISDGVDGGSPVRTVPAAVNEHGLVVGTLYRGDGLAQAFLWDPAHSTKPQLLGTLGGATSEALGINDAGYVVGSSTTRSGASHPFVWLPDRRLMTDLGVLPGYTDGVARDINAGSYVVGEAMRSGSPTRAFIWNPTTHRTRGLATPTGHGSTAYAINDHNVIVGGLTAPTSRSPTAGAVWGACSTPVQALDATGSLVIATGITRRERIVGYATGQPVWWQKAGPCT